MSVERDCNGHPDAHRDPDPYQYRDTYDDAGSHQYRDPHGDADTDGHGRADGNPDGDARSDGNPDGHGRADGNPDDDARSDGDGDAGGSEGPWALRVGGTGSDATKSVAIDGRGNIVVTGSFTGTADFGGGAMSAAGSSDVVVAKYTSTGAHVWSKRIGSVGLDAGYGVAIDRSANCDGAGGTDCVLVAGGFGYTVDFDPGPGTANLTTAGAGDVFVAKYSSAGTYLWAKRVGGERHELR